VLVVAVVTLAMLLLPVLLILCVILSTTCSPSIIDKLFNTLMKRESSIGSRVAQRKRGLFATSQQENNDSTAAATASPPPSRSRRRLNIQKEEYTDDDIAIIKQTLGHHQHHGTGNPLAMRAPSSPGGFAVANLAAIIQHGQVGQVSSDSTPKLKTERGTSGASFWTCRLRLAGSYGWTGLVLPEHAKTDNPLSIQDVTYFLVESLNDVNTVQQNLSMKKWNDVKERVVTVAQLAELARSGNAMK